MEPALFLLCGASETVSGTEVDNKMGGSGGGYKVSSLRDESVLERYHTAQRLVNSKGCYVPKKNF